MKCLYWTNLRIGFNMWGKAHVCVIVCLNAALTFFQSEYPVWNTWKIMNFSWVSKTVILLKCVFNIQPSLHFHKRQSITCTHFEISSHSLLISKLLVTFGFYQVNILYSCWEQIDFHTKYRYVKRINYWKYITSVLLWNKKSKRNIDWYYPYI